MCVRDTAVQRVFAELSIMDGTTSTYTAMIHAGGEPQPRAAVEGADDNDNDNKGPAPCPKTLPSVELAQLPGGSLFVQSSSNLTSNHGIYSTRLPKHN